MNELNLPATTSEINAAADLMVTLFEERMTADYSRETLKRMLCDHLQRGLVEMLTAIRWADEGDDVAHEALMDVWAETVNLHQRPALVLEAYVVKIAKLGPVTRKRGHLWRDNWTRNLGIATMVFVLAQQFGINRTRNRAQRRQGEPSASGVVAVALGRRHINVAESTVANISTKLNAAVDAEVMARCLGVPK
ncbi:MAG: hypothetical protein C0480_04240 [Bradyrhizobium sp.]|nr:hypothetical protein [Bradyrhizobium sp.]